MSLFNLTLLERISFKNVMVNVISKNIKRERQKGHITTIFGPVLIHLGHPRTRVNLEIWILESVHPWVCKHVAYTTIVNFQMKIVNWHKIKNRKKKNNNNKWLISSKNVMSLRSSVNLMKSFFPFHIKWPFPA